MTLREQRRARSAINLRPPRARWSTCGRCRGPVPFDRHERTAACPYCDARLRRPRTPPIVRTLLLLVLVAITAIAIAHLAANLR